MEDLRSKAYGEGNMQIEPYGVVSSSGMQDLRCYSASYASYQSQLGNKDLKLKKAKSTNGGSMFRSLSLSDPELQRKRRVAGYKVYAVEGKVKGSFKKSFRWFKDRYSRFVYGWR
ncbi:hypothetical protein M5689_023505 [Euphorbia peplus]|nr:hypothetical protein M5689_023505 [Euphorbia peplus]